MLPRPDRLRAIAGLDNDYSRRATLPPDLALLQLPG